MSITGSRTGLLAWVVMAAGAVGMATAVSTAAATPASATPASATPGAATSAGGDGRIAFVRAGQVFTMGSSGGSVKRLTTLGENSRPTWSPDGKRIAYIHEVNGRTDVWVMRPYGRGKRAVTGTGNVTSAGASWSPDGQTLALALDGQLHSVRSTVPAGSQTPTPLLGRDTSANCFDDQLQPVLVDLFVSWSPDGSRIAVFNHADCQFDDRIDWFYPATGERRAYAVSGADCCGYADWTNVFWGPGNEFGYSASDRGSTGEDEGLSRIVYPGFRSRDGDTGGAPSPSGAYLALTSTSSGVSQVVRANADGTGRRVLSAGSQANWQPLP